MNKNIALYIGLGISIVALGIVLFNDDNVQLSNLSLAQQKASISEKEKQPSDMDIHYSNNDVTSEKRSKIKKQKHKIKKKKHEKFVEAQTTDRSGTYEISLMNYDQDPSLKSTKYRHFSATIDGKPFYLDVPEHVITMGANTEIRIKNKKTGKTISVASPFINDLDSRSHATQVDFKSNDIENYEVSKRKNILPGASL